MGQGKVDGKAAEGWGENILQGELHISPAAGQGKCHRVKGQGKSGTESREGRGHGLFLEGERAAALPPPLHLSGRNWGKELDGKFGGPRGGVHGVSSGQAFHPNLPQFSPSC